MTTSPSTPCFDLTQLCDYARDVAEPGSAQAVRALLARSEKGRRTLRLFRRVRSVAQGDRAAEVPSYAVRIVKAVAGVQPHARPSSLLRYLPFSRTFDSLLAEPAGTRDLPSSHQRFTSFRSDDFIVHVKLEQETNPHSQVVIGQLLRHRPETGPVPDVPVLVLSGGRVVGRSLTSRFGEFQADRLPPDSLKLCLFVGPEDCIDLPLGACPVDD